MKKISFLFTATAILFILWGCVYTSTEKIPPREIYLIYPSNGASGVETMLTLSWRIPPHRELQPESFKVFISDKKDDVLKMASEYYSNSKQSEDSDVYLMKIPFRLGKGTEYYWRVVAHDRSYGDFPGPIWKFKTSNLDIIFSKVLPYDHPSSVIGDSDGFVVGLIREYEPGVIEKLDYSGNVIWKISLEDWVTDIKLEKSPDGGYIACFEGNLVKIGHSGGILEKKDLSGDCENIAMKEGNLYAVYRDLSGSVKIDEFDENLNRNEIYNMPSDVNNVEKLFVSSDGNFVIFGSSFTPTGERSSYVVKVDRSGGVVWKLPIGEDIIATDIAKVSDGYVLVGSHGNDMLIMKISESGGKIWNKVYSRHSDFGSLSSVLIPISVVSFGSGSVVTGFSTDEDAYSYLGTYPFDYSDLGKDFDAFVVKLDENGKIISLEKFGGSKGDMGILLSAIDENTVIVAGKTRSEDGDVNADIDESKFPSGVTWVFKVDINE